MVQLRLIVVRATGLDSPRKLRSSVSRGSDSRLGCHSLPLPFKSRHPYHAKRGCLIKIA